MTVYTFLTKIRQMAEKTNEDGRLTKSCAKYHVEGVREWVYRRVIDRAPQANASFLRGVSDEECERGGDVERMYGVAYTSERQRYVDLRGTG
jgi:hypothetical protein